jgi:hypothetical protein
VATDRLERRDEIIVDLDADRARVQTAGIGRRDIDQAEEALRWARDGHAEAEAAVQRARQAEAAARERVAELAAARLRDVSIVPRGAAPADRAGGRSSPIDGQQALRQLRARYRDATTRRRQATGGALDRARVVLVTAEDFVLVDELRGHRFDHLLVEQACLLDAAALCLAAAHIERSVVLAVDPGQRPPRPPGGEATRRWLGASVLELTALADPARLQAHPATLSIG